MTRSRAAQRRTPPAPPARRYLREHFGSRYASVGFTFDHGTVNSGWGGPPFTPRPFPVPPPPRGFAERPLGEVAHYMTGGSLHQWFDVLLHRQAVVPSRLLDG